MCKQPNRSVSPLKEGAVNFSAIEFLRNYENNNCNNGW